MATGLVATASIAIAADKAKVWDALTDPKALKKYFFGATVDTDWQVGSPITWSGEFEGKKYQDKGEILKAEPEQALVFTHFNSRAGRPDEPENYQTVTIHLSGEGKKTRVTFSQDNNADDKSRVESEHGWEMVLHGLKRYAESPPKPRKAPKRRSAHKRPARAKARAAHKR
jgi:uncharacterized protein YndB with AHSA1/START domain